MTACGRGHRDRWRWPGGAVTPRLVNRILNDIGDDHDQLPVVQHALMRMWEFWAAASDGEPIDIDDYEAVGTLRGMRCRCTPKRRTWTAKRPGKAHVAERVFKALTDTFADPRGIRRPTTIAELAAIADAPESDVVAVVEIFRRPGRSFLMPPPSVPLTSTTIVDVSHESLMRCWDRLIAWAEEERAAAAFYERLSQAAAWHADRDSRPVAQSGTRAGAACGGTKTTADRGVGARDTTTSLRRATAVSRREHARVGDRHRRGGARPAPDAAARAVCRGRARHACWSRRWSWR